jgi:hypothetical protein
LPVDVLIDPEVDILVYNDEENMPSKQQMQATETLYMVNGEYQHFLEV